MKGIVFNLLEQVVSDEYGEETWDALLAEAAPDGAYTSVGSYPDEEFLGLVVAASKRTGIPIDDLVRWFGHKAVAHFHRLYPQFFTPHADTRSFVLTLNDIIHPEVRKLFPGADVPDFDFSQTGDDSLSLGYSSPRKLCSFAEGLIEGAAEQYGERVTMVQSQCMKRGDPKCVIECRFEPAGAA